MVLKVLGISRAPEGRKADPLAPASGLGERVINKRLRRHSLGGGGEAVVKLTERSRGHWNVDYEPENVPKRLRVFDVLQSSK